MDAKCTNIKELYYNIVIVLVLDKNNKLPKDGLIRHIMEYVMYDELDNLTIRQAVRDWHTFENIDELRFKYGPFIGCWKTSKVTSLYRLFENIHNFNGDISGWDVSNVETMCEMLYNSWGFKGNLTGWNIKKVKCVTNFVSPIFPYWFVYVYNPKLFSMVDGLKDKFLQSLIRCNFCNCNTKSFDHSVKINFAILNIVQPQYVINTNIVLSPNITHLTFNYHPFSQPQLISNTLHN